MADVGDAITFGHATKLGNYFAGNGYNANDANGSTPSVASASMPSATAPNPNQTALTSQRTGLRLNGQQRMPMAQDPRLLNGDTSRPELGQSRDFTNELSGRPGGRMPQLPSDLREGVVHKTVDAQGRVTYSGRNVGQWADGSTQMVDGMGRGLKMRGSFEVAAPGSFNSTPDGKGYAFTAPSANPEERAAQLAAAAAKTKATLTNPDRSTWSANDNAVMAANLRDGADPYRGTSRQPAGNPGQDEFSNMPIKMATALRQQKMQNENALKTTSLNNEVTREGNQLTYQGTENRLGLDKARLAYEIGQASAKGVNDDNMKSTFATVLDKEGVPQVNQAQANGLGQSLRASAGRMQTPDGKPISLEQLRASNSPEYQRMRTAAETQFGLGQLVNKYAGGTTFGANTGWGTPKISNIREMGPSDWFKGASITDAMIAGAKPGYYSQGVEIDIGGRKQVVPIGVLLSDKNGGQYREMIDNWRVAHNLPPLGNMISGE